MSQIVAIPSNQITRLERRIDSLEKTMRRLLSVIEQYSASRSGVLQRLYASEKFDRHLEDTLTLFHQDRSQFVDPFATYQPQ